MSVLLLPVNVAITFDPQGKEPSCLLQRAICELPVVFVCVGIANLLEVTYSFLFRYAGGVTNMLMIQTLQSAAGNFGILTDSRTLPAPGLSPLLIYLPDNLPLCVYLCVPVCCCQKLHFVY